LGKSSGNLTTNNATCTAIDILFWFWVSICYPSITASANVGSELVSHISQVWQLLHNWINRRFIKSKRFDLGEKLINNLGTLLLGV